MKVTRIITKEVELDLDLNLKNTEATLLTTEEARKLPDRLRKYNDWWWLKSPCNEFDFRYPGKDFRYVKSVDSDGFIFPNPIDDDTTVVRPALIISNPEFSNLKIGDTFDFGGKQFEVISDDRAFCLGDIGQCTFREDWTFHDANDYEKSDVKKYVDEWFEKAKEMENET